MELTITPPDSTKQSELVSIVDKNSIGDGVHDTAIPGVRCIKYSEIRHQMPVVYLPSLCLVVQGAKQVMLEEETFHYTPSQYLIVSVDLPVVGVLTKASKTEPFLCFQLDVDSRIISEMVAQSNQPVEPAPNTSRGIFEGAADDKIIDAALRLARLLESPSDIPMLAPLVIREIYYRILNGPHGTAFAQIAVRGSNMQRIANVIQKLKADYSKTIRVEEMAEIAHMSPSSFHHHFKEVTAMSPLQYQKRLRLMEARRIMLLEVEDAASTAYRVGYESPSQFSREYSRMFGAPPITDIENLKSLQGYR